MLKSLAIIAIGTLVGVGVSYWQWHNIVLQNTPYVQVLEAHHDPHAHALFIEEAVMLVPFGFIAGCYVALVVAKPKRDNSKSVDANRPDN